MPNGYPKKMKTLVMAVNTELQALLDLFGAKKDVERDLEILYGITSVAEFGLAASQLEMTKALLAQATLNTKTLYKSAKQVSKAAAARS